MSTNLPEVEIFGVRALSVKLLKFDAISSSEYQGLNIQYTWSHVHVFFSVECRFQSAETRDEIVGRHKDRRLSLSRMSTYASIYTYFLV